VNTAYNDYPHYIRCLFVIQHQHITQPPNRINTPVNLDKK